MKKLKRIFWDIETSPNQGFFWRPGYKVQIGHDNIIKERAVICICWKEEGKKKVHSLEWDNNQCDKSMLQKFASVVDDADEMVAHNGDRFDMPWIKGRCLKHGIQLFPFAKTIDTLAWAKKCGLNSNRLDYLGKFLFDDGKIETEYGMWKDVILDDCPKAMAKMVKYCKKDVTLLEKVYQKLSATAKPKSHAGLMAGGEKYDCPHCGSDDLVRNRKTVTAAGTIHHAMRCKSCGKYSTINNKQYKEFKKSKEIGL